MAFTTNIDPANPTGSEPANTIDNIIREVRTQVKERFDSLTTGADIDPMRLKAGAIPANYVLTTPDFTGPVDVTGALNATGAITGSTTVKAGRATIPNEITGAVSVNFSEHSHKRYIVTGGTTFTLTGGVAGSVYTLEVIQDGTGGRIYTFASPVIWPSGIAPTITTTANRKDVYTFFFDGTWYLGGAFGLNYASTA